MSKVKKRGMICQNTKRQITIVVPSIKYEVLNNGDGTREIEFDISATSLSLEELQEVIKKEFNDLSKKKKNALFLHAEEGILVIGEKDYANIED